MTPTSGFKHPIEFFVRPDPDPHPYVAIASASNSAVVKCHAHRPGAWIAPQPFQAQARMRGVRAKSFIGRTRSRFDRRRKNSVLPPEFRCAGRPHSCLSNSSSVSSRNCEGSSRNRASISSTKLVNFGDGVGSRIIRSHSASPSSSGTSAGSDSASCARSSFERVLIAFWISSTVLTTRFYCRRSAFTTPRLVR